ncbi:MAG: hypothetical protein U1F25_13775 [Rubrivivax sp.]
MLPAYLTDDEIAAICRPLRQHAARIRFLSSVMKVPVQRRPDGSPLVKRADWDRQAENHRPANGPKWSRAA